jgi:putative transposase
MARLRRFALPGQPQHVIQRGNNRVPIFVRHTDYNVFLGYLESVCERHGCTLHAYVLMPNHFHLLVTPQDGYGISRAMQSLGRRYVGYFNAACKRTGTLWEGRYRAAPIDTERYLLRCYRYIELNPVRASMVNHPENYQWSSYRANASGATDPLITPHERYHALGADPESRRVAYRALFSEPLSDDVIREIRKATNGRWALGSKEFARALERLVDRRAQPLSRRRHIGGQTPAISPRDAISGV